MFSSSFNILMPSRVLLGSNSVLFLFTCMLGLPFENYSRLNISFQFFTCLVPFSLMLLNPFLAFDYDVQAFVLLASQSIRRVMILFKF